MSSIADIVEQLKLEKHVEGGYYRRTYCSSLDCTNAAGNTRQALSSIYYLITDELGYSALCVNESDIIIYHHSGAPITVVCYNPQSKQLSEHRLGSNLANGERPQFVCPGGIWKAYVLTDGEYSLISEAVSPSFDYHDMQLIGAADIPEAVQDRLLPYVHNS